MIFEFTEEAREQLAHWQRRDASKVKRIKQLLTAIRDDPFGGIGNRQHLQARRLGFGDAWTVRAQANDHICTAVFEVVGMPETLRTIADDGDGFALQKFRVCIFVVINIH